MKALHEKVDKLLEKGYIRPSNSGWACSPVTVAKKNNTWRICIDYRPLNKKTKQSAYPLPIMHRILPSFRGEKIISTIDLSNAFHKVLVEENS